MIDLFPPFAPNQTARPRLLTRISEAMRRANVVTLLGPRQSGKTTLARIYAQKQTAHTWFDLEDPEDAQRLDSPKRALEGLRGVVVIDEVQRQPALFELLRVLADRPERPAKFLLLGSAAPRLIRGVSESLAGRVETIAVSGFELADVGTGAALAALPNKPSTQAQLWLRGGYPRSFLSDSDADSLSWRENYIQTFLERDLPSMGFSMPPSHAARFWSMLAHHHGGIFNASELGRSLDLAHTTVARQLDWLSSTYVMRLLPPWFENLGKRLVKSPKVYVRDSGLLHALLRIPDSHALLGHPKLGASWEGFVIEQILARCGERDAYFYATQSGAELDLLLLRGNRRIGVEIKFSDAPRSTRSMHVVREDLKLDQLIVIYPGVHSYALGEVANVMSLNAALEILSAL